MNENRFFALGFMEKPYKVVKANSGGIRFSITSRIRIQDFHFYLLKNDCSHKEMYKISLGAISQIVDKKTNKIISFKVPDFYHQNTHDFWLTWYNDVISLGRWNQQALLTYPEVNTDNDKEIIGFVKFETGREHGSFHEWIVEISAESPAIYTPTKVPKVDGGELRWVKMNSSSILPIDALIGGFEAEPIYIARAVHRGSLCPGKYVKSKQLAYIPWGHDEISKNEFEILCGYDAIWIKCRDNSIPENAFIAGHSEVHHEPLFIGRAWVHKHLVVGKVHMLYKTCYLPYQGREVERSEYETLVLANRLRRGEINELTCYMKMFNNMQPCFKKKPC